MIIVLDTNVFVSHRFDLRAPDFQLLERAATLEDVHVLVPDVVVREVEHKFRETVSRHHAALARELASLRIFMPNMPEPPAVELEQAVGQFRLRFEAWRERCKVIVPPANAVTGDALLTRLFAGRKPFNVGSELGMRDAILWESVLANLASHELAFISENTKDFADKSGSAFHRDLTADLRRVGCTAFEYYPSIKAFRASWLDDAVREDQDEVDIALAKQILSNIQFEFQYRNVLVEALEESLGKVLPPSFDGPSISHLGHPEEISQSEPFQYGNRTIGFSLVLRFDVHVEGFMTKNEWCTLHEDSPITLDDPDWNPGTVTVAYEDTAWVHAALLIDCAAGEVSGFQIDGVEWGGVDRGAA